MAISNQNFAVMAAYLAGRVACWAGEVMDRNSPADEFMSDESVGCFLKLIREKADQIEAVHNSTGSSKNQLAQARTSSHPKPAI